jgi:hypothetical protein
MSETLELVLELIGLVALGATLLLTRKKETSEVTEEAKEHHAFLDWLNRVW